MAESVQNKKREIVITRIFDAPRELVWKVWTDPEMVKKWWGPKNFTAPVIKIDLREGGKYLYCMRGAVDPGGDVKDFWSTGTYRKIVPLEKLVVTDSFSDEEGNMQEPKQYGMSPDFPREAEVTVTFEDEPPVGGDKTKLTIRYASETDAAYDAMEKSGMEAGWNESLDKLAESLK